MNFEIISLYLEKCRNNLTKKIILIFISIIIAYLVFKNAHYWIESHCLHKTNTLSSCNNKTNFIRTYIAPILSFFIIPLFIYIDKIYILFRYIFVNKVEPFCYKLDLFLENLTSVKKWVLSFLISLCALVTVFYLKFSFIPLNPLNNLWLQNKADWNENYLGWYIFFHSPWEHSYSMLKNVFYPHEISVAYTESMVIFLFIFKLFKNILPDTFQFQGLWLFSCYILQPLFASLIVKDWDTKFLFKVISTLLISCAPILFFRYFHLALCAHWMILASFYLYMANDISVKKKLFFQSSLLVFSAFIHPYLVFILFFLNLALIFKEFILNKHLFKILFVIFFIQQAFIASIWYFTGYFNFVGGANLHRNTLTTNLNSFFNSADILSSFDTVKLSSYSNFLMPLASGKYQYEGFAYLGFGIILAFLIVIFDNRKEKSSSFFQKNKYLILFVGLLYFFALGNEIWFGSVKVLSYSFPRFIEKFLLPFQSCGRFVWPACYLTTIFVLYRLCHLERTYRKKIVLFLFIALIQIVDIQPSIRSLNLEKGAGFKTGNLQPWLNFMGDKHTKILFYPPYQIYYNKLAEYTDFWYLVGKYHYVTNMGYVARRSSDWDKDAMGMLKKIQTGNIETDAIYVTQLKNKGLFKNPVHKKKVVCVIINDFYVCKSSLSSRD